MSFVKRVCIQCDLPNNSPIIGGHGAVCIEVTGYCPTCLRDEVADLLEQAAAPLADPYAAEEARRLADRGEQWLTDDLIAETSAAA